MTDPSKVLEDGDVLRLEVSPAYAGFRVVPNGDEGNDANFPRNLHNAAELFLRLGMVPRAVRLKECVDAVLERYGSNPDGKSGVKLGRACVCWECGHCGLPKDYTNGQASPGPCQFCGGSAQVNWVGVTQKEGTDLPWIEESAMTEAQAKALQKKKEQELAEKRAAVEARVAEALAERQRQAEEAAANE